MYKAILIPTDEKPKTLEWETHPELEELQHLVGGGYIETVQTPELKDMTLLVNEEGILKGFPRNLILSLFLGKHIVGPGVLLLFEME